MNFLTRLRAANTARNDEWANKAKPFTLVFWANELAGEVGEACNILKKLDREINYGVRGSRATLPALAEELADVVICSDLLGMAITYEYREGICWPERNLNPMPDYSRMGAVLARDAGRACGLALLHKRTTANTQLGMILSELIYDAKQAADWLGIDLARSTATKFNMTSEKLGLQTRLS